MKDTVCEIFTNEVSPAEILYQEIAQLQYIEQLVPVLTQRNTTVESNNVVQR